jgi:tetratricopeptide (TPR) repeat protein
VRAKILLPVLLLLTLSCLRQSSEQSSPEPTVPAGEPATTENQMIETKAPATSKATGRDSGTLVPDPNESPEILARYHEARRLIAEGAWDQAKASLERAVAEFPESRHLHQQYADLLWHLSKGTDPALLRQAAREAVRAMGIGLQFGKVDYTLTARLAETLGRTGDKETLDRVFTQALAKDSSAVVYLDYAKGLSLLRDPRAEEVLKKAVQREPSGDALAQYGEWLLDHGREREVLEMIPENAPLHYLHFLRGVALERLNRPDEARSEYQRFAAYSATFPAPARFKIPGSKLQAATGIQFDESGRR